MAQRTALAVEVRVGEGVGDCVPEQGFFGARDLQVALRTTATLEKAFSSANADACELNCSGTGTDGG